MIRKTSVGNGSDSAWLRSSYSSSGDGNDCVEVASAPGAVRVRDSKDCQGPRLSFTAGAWEGFVSYVCGS
ncbi:MULTISPECIES: DUF397 domain-containing protein [unclassified Streptomyces]|uniref:DUF397 domain-containing protein n=1 Tax=unclassified Streptomyces TaxID=2593676 RepID=UPI0036F57B71